MEYLVISEVGKVRVGVVLGKSDFVTTSVSLFC